MEAWNLHPGFGSGPKASYKYEDHTSLFLLPEVQGYRLRAPSLRSLATGFCKCAYYILLNSGSQLDFVGEPKAACTFEA